MSEPGPDRPPAPGQTPGSSRPGERLTIAVPDPALVVLVGAAGSGKSTLAARHFAPDEILSSDVLREVLSGDPADQSVSRAAFDLLHRQASARLASGRLTVVDATSVDRRARRPLLAIAGSAGVPAVAIVLDLPAAVVLERNRQRPDRVVPAAVVRRQRERLRASLRADGIHDEGFDVVVWLSEPSDVDRLIVHRGSSGR